jgi:predicted GNAT family acetyltransferase
MENEATAADVRHNAAGRRFETGADGHLAVLDYELNGVEMALTHTFVPPELRGKGIAEKLVRAALAWARAEKRRVVPVCSYTVTFLQRYPELAGPGE